VPPSPRLPKAPATRELDLVERIFFLRQAAPFVHSSIDALAELSRGLVEVRYDPGTSLWQRGDPAQSIQMIVSGKVACTPADARSRFVLGAGAPLGGIESIAELPRWYDALTETRVVALSGDVEGLIDVFEDHFGMAMDYLAVVSQWLLRALEARVAEPQGLQEFYGCDEETLAASGAGAESGGT
jgi:CRP-like cAMP-binding protein